ncbi:TcaA NTF2-like domain-containing protein [Planococcus citreus]|uniref:TcaA NTF2-like domain-containing protein n=1 Tax=Planococcus citreus TaxID=1373 RepID=UPI0010810C4A|nr:hypothetical protein [Planococcus citreus]
MENILRGLLRKREELDTQWKSTISNTKILNHKIEFSRLEKKHIAEVKNWNKEAEKLTNKTRQIEKEITAFKELLENEIEQNFARSMNKSLPFKKNLQKTIELVHKRFDGISQDEIQIVRSHIELHKNFHQDVHPLVFPTELSNKNNEELDKVRANLNAISTLYHEENYELSLDHLERVISYRFNVLDNIEIDLSFVKGSAFDLKHFEQLEIEYKITEEQNRENIAMRATNLKIILAVAGGAAALTGMFLSYDSYDAGPNTSDQYKSPESYFVEEAASDMEEWFAEDSSIEAASTEPGSVEFALEEDESAETSDYEGLEETSDEQEETRLYDFSDIEIEEFFREYRSAYMSDLNGESTDRIADYINTDSDLYDALSDFVNDNSYTDNYYDFEENEVLSIQRGKVGEYEMLARETFYLYGEDDSEFYNSRTKEYTLATNSNDELRILGYETIEKSNEMIKAPETEDEEFDTDTEGIETVYQVTEEQISSMVSSYYTALEDGFNGGGFGIVDYYLSHDGAEYEPTKEYIEKAIDENMKMINHELTVEDIEIHDSNHYVVTVYLEDEYHYQSGAGDIKEVRAQYLIKVTEYGDMLIEEMLSLDILNKYEL